MSDGRGGTAAQAIRPALSRAGLGRRRWSRAIAPAAGRRVPRNWAGHRRAHAAARRDRRADSRRRDRSRSRRGPGAARARQRHGPHGRLPARSTSCRSCAASQPQRPAGRARPTPLVRGGSASSAISPTTCRRRSSSRLIEAPSPDRVVRRRDGDAAARGRGSARRAAGHERLRRRSRCSSRCTRRRHASSTCRRARSGRRRRCARAVVRLTFGPPAGPRDATSAGFERLVKPIFSPAPEDARSTRSSASTRRRAAVLAMSGLDGRRRPETLQVDRDRTACRAVRFGPPGALCYSFAQFSSLFFGSLPATHLAGHLGRELRRARAVAVLGRALARLGHVSGETEVEVSCR